MKRNTTAAPAAGRRRFLSRTLSLAGGLAAAPVLAGLGAAGQETANGPLETSFNAATDKLNRTRQGPITRPMIVEIAPGTFFLNEFGMDAQYVLIGQTRALAIDTGSGFYDYKGTIQKLTSLPYDVVVTHGHPDHAGGIGQFDRVYLHPKDVPMVQHLTQAGAKRYGEIMWNMNLGYHDVWGYTPADAKWGNWGHLPAIQPLHDGQIFDLGGRQVTVYHIPGHTAGSCVFLDNKAKIVFSGDAANRNVGATATAMSTLLRGLIRLQAMRDNGAFEQMYNGHTAYAGSIDVYSETPAMLDDVIEAFRSLLRGNAQLRTMPNHMFPQRTMTVAVHGGATVGFDPKRLWEPGEPHIVP